MTECPLEHQVSFPSLGEKSVRDYASRHAQLSIRGKQSLDRLLVLLPSHLESQPTSRISPFSPALLFSICDVLQRSCADSSVEQDDTSVLPSVLSKLRDWRLLDPNYRYSSGGVHKLALDLAGITDEASASTSSDVGRTSHGRLRMKWVGGSDSHNESQDREPSSSTPPSSSSSRSGVRDSAQKCAHVLPDLNQRRSDAGYESFQAGRLGTPDSEDASAVVSRRHHSVSGFRSGCSACRHTRVSGPSSLPSSPSLEQRTLFGDVNQLDTNIKTSVSSPRHPKPTVQHITTKKTKRENQKSLQSIHRGAHVDENEPPVPKPPGVQQGIGISLPRQRTHSPRISNAFSSREPFPPVTTSVQRRMEPSNLPNRTREGDKHTSSHRVASVDLLLPIAKHFHSPTRASSIDLHPHTPNRAQSLSYTPVNSHGFGSVAGRVPKLPLTSVILNPTGSLPPPPAKTRSQNPRSSAPSRPWIQPSVPSDVKRRDRRSVSSQTHKHTQSAGCLPSSPLLAARKWQV